MQEETRKALKEDIEWAEQNGEEWIMYDFFKKLEVRTMDEEMLTWLYPESYPEEGTDVLESEVQVSVGRIFDTLISISEK